MSGEGEGEYGRIGSEPYEGLLGRPGGFHHVFGSKSKDAIVRWLIVGTVLNSVAVIALGVAVIVEAFR